MSVTTGRMIRFPEGRVFVREVGEGAPLLLINGLGAHTAMWAQLEQALPGFRLVDCDRPGAGRSAVPWRPVSIRRLARLSAAVMEEFGIASGDVLGYSMGGVVAQQLAADHPERVRRMVLAATTPGVGAVLGDLRALANIITPARYLSPKLYARSVGSLVGGRARHDGAFVAEQSGMRFQHAPTWRGYLGQLQSMATWTGLPVLPRISHPTLLVFGGDDPLAPVVNGMIIAHLLPRGRLLVYPDEGHLLVMDPDSVCQADIRDFLTAEPLERSGAWARAAEVDSEQLRTALARVRRQVPPWSVANALARRRWLALDRRAS